MCHIHSFQWRGCANKGTTGALTILADRCWASCTCPCGALSHANGDIDLLLCLRIVLDRTVGEVVAGLGLQVLGRVLRHWSVRGPLIFSACGAGVELLLLRPVLLLGHGLDGTIFVEPAGVDL